MWKKSAKIIKLVIALAIFAAPLPFANACGVSYLGEDYRVALLNSYVIGGEWSPFFYTSEWMNSTENDKKGIDRQRNCSDWAKYMGDDVTFTDVQQVVYGASHDDLLNAVAEGADNQQFGANAFFQKLLTSGKKEVLEYLLLAKEYEESSNGNFTDPWSNNAVENPNLKITSDMAAAMDAKFKIVKDPFLRRRYAYQLLVMSRYAGNIERFEQLYAEHFRDKRTDALADWASFHRAGVVSDPVEANYLLAMAFGNCPEKRIYCYQHFDKKLVDKTLAFCKNDQEKAVLLGLASLRNPGRALDAIQQIAALDPNCKLLPLLAVREVNKLEDWLLTDELTGMGESIYISDDTEERWSWTSDQWEKFRAANKQKDLVYLVQVRDFMASLASQKGGALLPDLCNLLTGHLYLMDKKGEQAEKYLNAISPKANGRVAEQQLTEQVLLLLNRSDITKADVKAKLAGLLTRLQPAMQPYKNGKRDFEMLNLLLSHEYLRKGELLTAYFFNNHSLELPTDQRFDYGTAYYELFRFLDWRATEKDIDDLLAIISKKNKTAFERYLTATPLPSRNALMDLRGTISFRKNDLKEAIAGFEKVDKDFWKTKYEFSNHLVSDPFVVASDSLHRGQFPASKTAFVQQLLKLEEEAKANPTKAAENYLRIGTAWLNCTYGSKTWMMFCYGNSVAERSDYGWANYSYQPKRPEMSDVYYGGKRAIEYIEKAKALTKDKELLAEAEYLIARQKSRSYMLSPEEQKVVDALEWGKTDKFFLTKEMSYFKDWASTYKSTSYYDEMAVTCPILVTYFGK